MIRVGIVGGSGYTGVELVRILSQHPEVSVSVVTSRQYAGQKVAAVYPHLHRFTDLVFEDVVPGVLSTRAEVFFTAVPHKTAMDIIPVFLDKGKKVIDLSADFRLHDRQIYEEWYQVHTSPQYLPRAVYGLPEIHRDSIRNADLVANPGCYPTSIILALAPLLQNKLIDPHSIIADSKSGTSGAGRAAQIGNLYCEVNEGFKAYKIGEHRHTPEIEQELSGLAETPLKISFTPHLVPMSRGILSTIYGQLLGNDTSEDAVRQLYNDYYHDERFVRVLPKGSYPATQFVRGSNNCDIGLKIDTRTGRIVVVSAIDNLVKGAAGQAVQNMNILLGCGEDCGLHHIAVFP